MSSNLNFAKSTMTQENSSLGESGVSLMMTLLMLGTLLIISTTVASVVFRVGSFSKNIVAFLAAEAAVERALYKFEAGGASLAGLAETGSLASISGAGWTTSAWASTTPPLNNSAVSASSPTNPVSNSNPLQISLQPGQAFEMDMSLVGVNYPSNLNYSWPGGATQQGKIVWYSTNGQASTTEEAGSNVLVPPSGQINPTEKWQTKIINENSGGGSAITFTMTPAAGQDLPMRAVISATGVYLDQAREVQVLRPLWLVY
jgi:hypothetical protein